jgi:hypothetical protein
MATAARIGAAAARIGAAVALAGAGGYIAVRLFSTWYDVANEGPYSARTFVDEFDGPAGAAPNPAYWSRYCCAPTGSTQTPGAARLDGYGHLLIRIRNSTEAGAITSQGKVQFAQPFTATAVVKWPRSNELWHGFWWVSGVWYSEGELDFYETGYPSSYQTCAHEWAEGVHLREWCRTGIFPPTDATANWHTYGARVANGTVTYLLDGQAVATRALSSRFTQPGRFLFSLWPNNAASNQSGYPATLKVARIVVTSG